MTAAVTPTGRRIGVTLGDPSGIGPEVVAAALADAPPELVARVVVFGDAGVLERTGRGVPAQAELVRVTQLTVVEARPGSPTLAGATAQVAYLEAAVEAARRGGLGAIVTGPISKTQLHAAGLPFPGHTELLAARLNAAEHAMMFVGPRLRVVLATIHLGLGEMVQRLQPGDVATAVTLGGRSLARELGVARPRIGVAGLNPHAGEGGLFGDQEARVIQPGIDQGRARLHADGIGAEVSGPLVPDVVFRQALEGRWDLVVAMYHDQGLIPVKLIDFDESVNVTLGLPIVRTSPDHGVAYDIAGTGRARPTSFAAALRLAATMTAARGA